MTNPHTFIWLSAKNIEVVRYWNNDIFGNLPGVLADLTARLEKRAREGTPSPTLPLSGGGSTHTPLRHDGDGS